MPTLLKSRKSCGICVGIPVCSQRNPQAMHLRCIRIMVIASPYDVHRLRREPRKHSIVTQNPSPPVQVGPRGHTWPVFWSCHQFHSKNRLDCVRLPGVSDTGSKCSSISELSGSSHLDPVGCQIPWYTSLADICLNCSRMLYLA